MQAQKRFAQLVLPVVLALPGFAARAADAPATATGATAEAVQAGQAAQAGQPVQAPVAPVASTAPAAFAAPVFTAPAAPVETTAATNTTASAAPSAPPAAAAPDAQFGVALDASRLDSQRGGDAMVGQNNLTGTVADNTAYKVVTGSNSISDGSFSNSSGLPTVIQNTGANVLIQNATVLNVRFGN